MAARKLLLSLGLASVVAAGVAAAGSGAAEDRSAPCGPTPSLRLVDSDPVTFKGSGFCARERLRVRARAADTRRSKRLRASGRGRFRVRFAGIAYDPCSGSLSASARRSGDLRASFKRAQKQCPAPLQPAGPPDVGGDPAPYGSGPPHDRCTGTEVTASAGAVPKPGPGPQCPLP